MAAHKMFRIAIKMLFFDRAKYVGLVFGIAFSILLINQQLGIFIGLLNRAAAIINDVPAADIWVMDCGVKNLDTVFPLRDTELGRVRGVLGVQWAVPFFKSSAIVRTDNGQLESALIIGADDSSLLGLPSEFLLGNHEDLRRPDAVALGADGYNRLWPNEPIRLGKTFELNDRRAVLVAIVRDSPKFTSTITFYARYSLAVGYTNNGRNQLSFILARSNPGAPSALIARRIETETGLLALPASEFRWRSIMYVAQNTGIPVSFGTVIGLGILVGVSVVGLLFNLFVLDNLRHFAVLKAIGITNWRLLKMVLLQAAIVGFVGYSFGLGSAAMFFEFAAQSPNFAGFYLPWQVGLGSGCVAAVIIAMASLLALRRVLLIEPAVVFRG